MTTDPSEKPLSPWWRHAVILVMVFGFSVLTVVTVLTYTNAPPIPERVTDAAGATLFTREDVEHGQEVFLKYGLMEHGTLWGHGAYLGPDYSAEYLHRLAEIARDTLARERHGRPYAELDPDAAAGLDAARAPPAQGEPLRPRHRHAAVLAGRGGGLADAEGGVGRVLLGHDARAGPAREVHPRPGRARGPQLVLRVGGVGDGRQPAREGLLLHQQLAVRAGGRQPAERLDLPLERAQPRHPARRASAPSSSSSAASTTSAGTATSASGHAHDSALARWTLTPSQKAVGLYFGVVALLFLLQALAGGALAHYRVESGAFYGIDLARFFPYNLLRTFHLQLAIFWIATAWVAGGLFLAPIVGGAEPRGQRAGVLALLARPRRRRLRQPRRRVAGHQRPPGRASGSGSATRARSTWTSGASGSSCWRSASWAGSSSCTGPCARRSAIRRRSELASLFLYAAAAIPLFYLPALFFGPRTNFAVIDNWRFWIIHLWVEGFFELFATVLVAVMFVVLGLVTAPHGHARHLPRRHPLPGRRDRRHRATTGTSPARGRSTWAWPRASPRWRSSRSPSSPSTPGTSSACATGGARTAGRRFADRHRWAIYFLMAVGFWNFVGAGVFGFLINLPIVSYFEVGTALTSNHGHAALFGVFGMLALAVLVFCLRSLADGRRLGARGAARSGSASGG